VHPGRLALAALKCHQKGNHKKANEVCDRVIRIVKTGTAVAQDEILVLVWTVKGLARLAMKQTGEARAAFQTAMKYNEAYIPPIVFGAAAEFCADDITSAEDLLHQAVKRLIVSSQGNMFLWKSCWKSIHTEIPVPSHLASLYEYVLTLFLGGSMSINRNNHER